MKKDLFIGVMSGTSMDGLDVAACRFNENGFEIVKAETFLFPSDIKQKLQDSSQLAVPELGKLDADFGRFIGETVRFFLKEADLQSKTVAIASHGHTVTHEPNNRFTLQIGSGAHMARASGLPAIVDFRSNDVAAGGQGAPLVPIGDLHLFSEYNFCLNLGGIANISFKDDPERIRGLDICGCNLILNALAQREDKPYDENGRLARAGNVHQSLLAELLDPIQIPSGSYSLDAKEATEYFFIKADMYNLSVADLLATAVEYITKRVDLTISQFSKNKTENTTCLVTGGGAHNSFLMERMKRKVSCKLIIPDNLITDYKEALIFAYMGFLRWQGKHNCLASVTGASENTIGGAVYLP